MGLPALALVLILSSALLHALWNVLLGRAAPKGFDAGIVSNALGWLALTPLALVRWRVDDAAWGYLAVSACFSVTYFLLLNVAYARVPVHAAYPVARGLAPVLVLLVTLAAGDAVPARAGLGVLVISMGIFVTASGASSRSVLAAAPVAVSLTCYTYVASLGLKHTDPSTYLWLSMAPLVIGTVTLRLLIHPPTNPGAARPGADAAGSALGTAAAGPGVDAAGSALGTAAAGPGLDAAGSGPGTVAAGPGVDAAGSGPGTAAAGTARPSRRGADALRAEVRPITFVIGLGSIAAHVLTLAALALVTAAQVPAVAALRETGILFVIALSWLSAHTRESRPTLRTALGATLVFAGVAVLALTR
ncbi:hypothetical protein JIG36_13610 [Actinoplanes sp. LDG1-06]|uniref:EamA domain-containing protein n=1 Tax=Paractinoplanes ovalisporus TaxID=2810368 RepID=A0ABS2ABE5_9ACTN|nr:hypothetical protein [Actinoplanes ovalisporus]MBM2616596.1 hypothetical protein [Actinoplanes ovalisporus]